MAKKASYISIFPNPESFLIKIISLMIQEDKRKKDANPEMGISIDDLLSKINTYQNRFNIRYFHIINDQDKLISLDFEDSIELLKNQGLLEIHNSEISLDLTTWGDLISNSFTLKEDEERIFKTILI